MIYLSQTQLNILAKCPRQFQYNYLEMLGSPASLEQQMRANWGSRFHLLMQQREMGLPIEPLLMANPEMAESLTALLAIAPDIFELESNHQDRWREAEHQRVLSLENCLITVVYDLLIATNERAQIIDWKTYQRPEHQQYLSKNWQTKLYPYVLVETSNYDPTQVEMIYWFVVPGELPQSWQFQYNRALHQKIDRELKEIISNLTIWIEKYHNFGEPLPQIAKSDPCANCQFFDRCWGQADSFDDSENLANYQWANLAEIEEIPI